MIALYNLYTIIFVEFGGLQDAYPLLLRIAKGWPIRSEQIDYRGQPEGEVQERLMQAGIAIDLGLDSNRAASGESVAK